MARRSPLGGIRARLCLPYPVAGERPGLAAFAGELSLDAEGGRRLSDGTRQIDERLDSADEDQGLVYYAVFGVALDTSESHVLDAHPGWGSGTGRAPYLQERWVPHPGRHESEQRTWSIN